MKLKKAVKLLKKGKIAIYKDCDNLELLKYILECAFPDDDSLERNKQEAIKSGCFFRRFKASPEYWTYSEINKRRKIKTINLSKIKPPKQKSFKKEVKKIVFSNYEPSEKIDLIKELCEK